ncbi:MAG: prepilin-type N-terminal cleavage/methylation domain-containing protein [Acidobacteriota bacterium]
MINLSHRDARGFSLVEVLVSMGIISGILLSIVTLFFFGRRNVYSGKQMTEAVAVGTHATEDLSSLSGDDIYDAFVITSADTLGSYTIDGVSYTNAILRSTDPNVVASPPTRLQMEKDPDTGASPPDGFLTTWKDEMNSTRKFQDGSVTLVILPRSPTQIMAGTTPDGPAPGLLSVRTIVRWKEARRNRSVTFDTLKPRRGF